MNRLLDHGDVEREILRSKDVHRAAGRGGADSVCSGEMRPLEMGSRSKPPNRAATAPWARRPDVTNKYVSPGTLNARPPRSLKALGRFRGAEPLRSKYGEDGATEHRELDHGFRDVPDTARDVQARAVFMCNHVERHDTNVRIRLQRNRIRTFESCLST